MEHTNLIFGFYACNCKDENEALLLTASIRSFAGRFCENPIWMFTPNGTVLSKLFLEKADELNLSIKSFNLPKKAVGFPFAEKVYAASEAEKLSLDNADILVWLDKDSLVFKEPTEFVLPDICNIALTPVDHTLIGSCYEQPISDFWRDIYNDCNVDETNIFELETSVDNKNLRAYFNAGLIVIRPILGFLQRWCEVFEHLFLEEKYQKHYKTNKLYAIFMHQAVLAGLILHTFSKERIKILSKKINYPIHMHETYPLSIRPTLVDKEMQTARYDMYFDKPNGNFDSIFSLEFRKWLKSNIGLITVVGQ